jgi:hypothetical protein
VLALSARVGYRRGMGEPLRVEEAISAEPLQPRRVGQSPERDAALARSQTKHAERLRRAAEVRRGEKRMTAKLAAEAQAMAESGEGRISIDRLENVLITFGMRKLDVNRKDGGAEGLEIILEVYKRRSAVEKPQAPAARGGEGKGPEVPNPESAPVMPGSKSVEALLPPAQRLGPS